MPRIPALSGGQVIRVLEKTGYLVVRQRGSHVKLRKGEMTVIVPVHSNRPLKRSTMMGIFKDAGLSLEDLRRLLD